MKRQMPDHRFLEVHIKEFVMKLRMTGFESHRIFVIRLCKKSNSEEWGPPLMRQRVSVFHKNLMSFPIYFDVV